MTFAHDDTLVAYFALGLGIRKLLRPFFPKSLDFLKIDFQLKKESSKYI